MISFLLIGNFIGRSFTLSSAFSAIGFNRIGDVVLGFIVATFSTSFCSGSTDTPLNTPMFTALLIVTIFKSVMGLTWL